MVKKILVFILYCFFLITINAQKGTKINLYNPNANAASDIDSISKIAKKENKNILVQVGGNWCVWCIRLHNFIQENGDLKRLIDMDYVTYKLNYSKENFNEAILKKFKNPERFGFPVLLILDADGNLIHTQDSGLLEDKEGYSKEKLFLVFKNWTPRAVAGKSE